MTVLHLENSFTYLNLQATLKAIISHSYNLTFRFLTVLSLIFTFSVLTTPSNTVWEITRFMALILEGRFKNTKHTFNNVTTLLNTS